jgi:phage terminase small subunit
VSKNPFGFNGKRLRFVQEYLIDMNATQAAIRAGYSKKTAYSQGQRLLKNAEIQAAIVEAMATRSERTEISQDEVLKKLWQVASSDDHTATKVRALELVGKHLGMFTDIIRHEGEMPTLVWKVAGEDG